jgi:predicted nucleotidyltransferase
MNERAIPIEARGVVLIPPIITPVPMDPVKRRLVEACPILANRFPSQESGTRFMRDVDYVRRDELFGMAVELSEVIAIKWQETNPPAPIAIILYGSVAKGLVRHPDHPDPSDIDLAVIGTFSDRQQEVLRHRIADKVEEIHDRVVATAPGISSENRERFYACVKMQHRDKLTKNNFSTALNYIQAGAVTLHDPSGLWHSIEQEALGSLQFREKPKHRRQPKQVFVYDEISHKNARLSNLLW